MIAESSTTTNINNNDNGPLSQFAFPRTGKRGVPQQFPRRLYEMLDGETKKYTAMDSDAVQHHPKLIVWSNSGKAFRIQNVSQFASIILPKYFRTTKFSSFQRNLNLYGFTKVRKGVDTDMYAHPFFLRDNPKALLHLQKTTSSSSASNNKNKRDFNPNRHTVVPLPLPPRPISPSISPHTIEENGPMKVMSSVLPAKTKISRPAVSMKITIPSPSYHHHWSGMHYLPLLQRPTPVSPPRSQQHRVISACDSCSCDTYTTTESRHPEDRGKLDLLALALEQEIAEYHVH